MTDELHRHSTRLKGYDYSAAGEYYVTVAAFLRECLFGDVGDGEMRLNALGRIVQECWDEIPSHFPNAGIDAFVVMPNHVHGIIFIHDNDVGATHIVPKGYASPLQKHASYPHGPAPRSLGAIVDSFKSSVTRRAGRELNGRAGAEPASAVSDPRGPGNSANIWQRNYYEHILRDQTDYERIAGYILANPTSWDADEENPHSLLVWD